VLLNSLDQHATNTKQKARREMARNMKNVGNVDGTRNLNEKPMTVADLRSLCKQRGVPKDGNKAKLVERLNAVMDLDFTAPASPESGDDQPKAARKPPARKRRTSAASSVAVVSTAPAKDIEKDDMESRMVQMFNDMMAEQRDMMAEQRRENSRQSQEILNLHEKIDEMRTSMDKVQMSMDKICEERSEVMEILGKIQKSAEKEIMEILEKIERNVFDVNRIARTARQPRTHDAGRGQARVGRTPITPMQQRERAPTISVTPPAVNDQYGLKNISVQQQEQTPVRATQPHRGETRFLTPEQPPISIPGEVLVTPEPQTKYTCTNLAGTTPMASVGGYKRERSSSVVSPSPSPSAGTPTLKELTQHGKRMKMARNSVSPVMRMGKSGTMFTTTAQALKAQGK